MKAPRRAFTLIELLIVVAIIAILAAIAVPNFLEAQVRSKVSRAKGEIRTLDVALTAYHVDQGDYPPWNLPLISHPASYTRASWRMHRLTTPVAYITTIPKDPFAIFREFDEASAFGGALHARWDTYDYANNYFYPPASDAKSLWGHWWRLSSFGPDNYNQFAGGRTTWAGVSPAAFDQFPNYIYDSTNGVVSWGDIVRVGPRCFQSRHPYHPIEQLQ